MKNAIDLACMEGAVSAALDAATQILKHHGETGPFRTGAARMAAGRIGLRTNSHAALVAVARLIAWLEEKFSPHQRYTSNIRRKATPSLQRDTQPPCKFS